jgi:hypothetical protein
MYVECIYKYPTYVCVWMTRQRQLLAALYVRMYAGMHVCMFRTYVSMYVCMNVCMCAYVSILVVCVNVSIRVFALCVQISIHADTYIYQDTMV